jgi:hypothetical protein
MPKSTKKRGTKKRGTKRSPATGEEAKIIPFGAKARFVREQPADMPASAVIARALEAGIPLSENHVYATRKTMKEEAKVAAATGASATTRPSTPAFSEKKSGKKNGSPEAATPVGKAKAIEMLESWIFRVGWEDAKQVFERMEQEHFVKN